jgi:hypothetical protein
MRSGLAAPCSLDTNAGALHHMREAAGGLRARESPRSLSASFAYRSLMHTRSSSVRSSRLIKAFWAPRTDLSSSCTLTCRAALSVFGVFRLIMLRTAGQRGTRFAGLRQG